MGSVIESNMLWLLPVMKHEISSLGSARLIFVFYVGSTSFLICEDGKYLHMLTVRCLMLIVNINGGCVR